MTTDNPSEINTPAFWLRQWEQLNATRTAFAGYGSAHTWNAMASGYGRGTDNYEMEERVRETVGVLEKEGFRFSGARVLDIGCGPGWFAEAFAERGAKVVCIDISKGMIERLKTEVAPAALERITAFAADWRAVNLNEIGGEQAFDLVFANMTPAVSGPETFLKLIRASRDRCWFRSWAGPRENPLMERLYTELKGKKATGFHGNFVCALNLVCASGFFPSVSFSGVSWTHKKTVDEWTDFFSVFFSEDGASGGPETKEKIKSLLTGMAIDGTIKNPMRGHTGRMVWSVRKETGGNK